MKFPALDSNTNDIEITFSSMKEDSLLVYNFGQQSGGRSDFIAIELVAGKAVFSFGGARTAITKITVDKYLANGRWHKVTATRNNRVASLSVSDCAESGEFCKLCKAGDETCFAKDIGESGTLNFNTNALYFGGIDDVQEIVSRVGQVASDDFIGCFKSLSITGQQLNLKSGYTDARGILASCPIPGSLCSRHNCQTGKCIEMNWKPVCVCDSGIIAANCESSLTPISLESNGTVTIKPTELHKRQQLFLHPKSNNNNAQDLGFRFRTENNEGRIFYAESKRNTEFTSVYIREGRVVYETRKNSFPQINVTSTVEVTDGAWHFIR
jgi:protocadherin Fat 4